MHTPDRFATAFVVIVWAIWLAYLLGWIVKKSRIVSDTGEWLRHHSPTVCALVLAALLGLASFAVDKNTGNMPQGMGMRPLAALSVPATRPEAASPSLAVVSVWTNGVTLRAESTNAVEITAFRRIGGSEIGDWVECDDPCFRIGTSDFSRFYVSASGTVSFGTKRRPPVGEFLPSPVGRLTNAPPYQTLCPLRAHLGMVPEANWGGASRPGEPLRSRFWHDALPSGGRVLTWEDALVDRLPGRRVSLQVEMRSSGDSVFRYSFQDELDPPATNFVMGAQMGTNGVNALSILGTNTLAATVWNVDGAPVTNGVSIVDLLCTNGVLRTPAAFEIRWKNTTGLDPEADTDEDGLTDWAETFLWGTEAGFADTDGDGRSDGDEIAWGDDPFNADEDGDGVPDGTSAAAWAAHPLWASNATNTARAITITLNNAVPTGASAALMVGDLCIPLRSPRSWSLGLVPGELYPYRLNVTGNFPVDLSIGPGESAPPMRGDMNAMSIALWLDGVGGTFDGWSLGGSGNMAIPTLNVSLDDPDDGSHEGTYGGVCLHGGTEAVFTPMLRPATVHDQWLLNNLEERNGKLVLSVPDGGVPCAGTATLFTSKIRFGMLQAAVSAHRCDSWKTHPLCSVCGCYLPYDLAVSVRTPLTLKHDNQTSISIIHAYSYGYSHSNGVIEIRRKGDTVWSVLGSETGLDPWTARIAGVFELRGRATVGEQTWTTPATEFEVQFPSYYDIIGDDTVFTAMTNAWQMTKDGCTEIPNERHEVGCWIQLDTVANSYVIGTITNGPSVGPTTNGAVHLGPRPSDSSYWPDATDAGAVYTVAAFHTHTPRTYLTPTNRGRWVGPSPQDYINSANRQLVGIVYDYIGTPDPYGNPTNRLYNGHPKDDPARLYPVPPMRRPTPRLPEDTP